MRWWVGVWCRSPRGRLVSRVRLGGGLGVACGGPGVAAVGVAGTWVGRALGALWGVGAQGGGLGAVGGVAGRPRCGAMLGAGGCVGVSLGPARGWVCGGVWRGRL